MKREARVRSLMAIVALALAVRGAVLYARFDSLSKDPDGYRAIAANLVEHGVYARNPPAGETKLKPTAFRPPLYVMLLAAISPTGPAPSLAVGLLHCALGAAAAAVVYLLALYWGLGRASYLAAGLFIFDPLSILSTTEVMTETLATLIVAAALLVAGKAVRSFSWRMALALGAVLGLAVMCRPTFWPFAVVTIAWQVFSNKADSMRRDTITFCLVGAFLAIVVPWGLRNQFSIGKGILTTTHGGYTKWLGNSEEFYDHLHATRGSPVYDAESVNVKYPPSGDELADDERFDKLASAAIRRRPTTFLWASALRIGWLWNPLPHQLSEKETLATRLARYAVGVWYAIVFVLAAVGLWRLKANLLRAPWVFAVLLCLSVTVVHMIYWSNMRMRAPLVPAISLFAAAALVRFPLKENAANE